ncbi:MAG TPA: DEAD/DEAH box helicase, partial [bacterium]|nr:DEAD/DEAH box helicase [bacterium]
MMETPTQETAAETPATPHPTFESMDLSPEVRRAITDELKYASPTPVQSAAFGPIRAGRDVVVQSRTGTGKTAAFGIPLADKIDPNVRAPQMLVLAPTRELASQDGTELDRINRYKGNRVLAIYGGAAFGPQLEGLKAGAQIIAGTPGRVLDHLRRGTLKLDQCRYLVLDEADEMLSMGFQDELESILEFIPRGAASDSRPRAQTMLFSATFPPEIKRMIDKHLREPQELTLTQGNIAPDQITHYYYVTSHMRKASTLLTLIDYEEPESAIIFTNTREDANFIGGFLKNRGLDAEVLTGELTQSQREKVMRKIKAGNLQYLVATDVAARGIDINDLSHVFNYNLPDAAEVYVHRTGRTGRAGKTGTAVSIVSGLDISTLYALTKWMKIRLEERPIPTEAEVKAHKLDREVKKLVDHVRGRIEDGHFADPENNRWLAIADRVMAQPQAREVVATLLEKMIARPAAEAAVPAPATVAPASVAATPAEGAAAAAPLTGSALGESSEISAEQREFEEQQMRRARGGGGGGRGRERGGERGGRGGERGGERGGRGRD